jgi:adenosine deaminase
MPSSGSDGKPLSGKSVADFVRRLPKVDLHCHLLGTVRMETARDLARRHDVALPVDPGEFYPNIDSSPPIGEQYRNTVVPLPTTDARPTTQAYSLLKVSEWIADVVRDRDDFARIGYEAVEDAYLSSNTKHVELHVELGWYLARGIDYATVLDGLDSGLTAAAARFGTSSLLIAGIDRSKPASVALEVLETVVANPRDRLVGIGLDNLETVGPPESFADAYALAARAGLRRTAHCGEHDPSARNVVSCLDALGCERLDHGYFVLEDPVAVARCRDAGVVFSCIFTTSRRSWRPWRRQSIQRMVAENLPVVFASDDPAMFPTTLAAEYAIAADALTADPLVMSTFALRSVEASWLPDDEKRALTRKFREEIEALLAEFDIESTPTQRISS